MEADRLRLVYLDVESINTPRRVGSELTARFVRQFLRTYPPELRERAVRVVVASSDQHESEWAAVGEVARLFASCRQSQGPSPADSHHRIQID